MGKKNTYSGESPSDRAVNFMDKFMSRGATNRVRGAAENSVAETYKADPFESEYNSYSVWYEAVKKSSGVYPTTFVDFTQKLKPELQAMWNKKMWPRAAVLELRKYGVY
jgi:hypothetical protein